MIGCGNKPEATEVPISIEVELEEFEDVSRTIVASFLDQDGTKVASVEFDLAEQSEQSVDLPRPGAYTVELSTTSVGDSGCGTCQTFFGGNTLDFQAADGLDLKIPLDVVIS